jgi:hypothetical protein
VDLITSFFDMLIPLDWNEAARIKSVGLLPRGVFFRSNLFTTRLVLPLGLPILGRPYGEIRLLQGWLFCKGNNFIKNLNFGLSKEETSHGVGLMLYVQEKWGISWPLLAPLQSSQGFVGFDLPSFWDKGGHVPSSDGAIGLLDRSAQ